MPGPPFLRGDGVALHAFAEEDYEFLQRNWNHPEVRPGFGLATPTTRADVEERIDEISDDDEAETFCVCVDGDAADATPVGEAFLFDLHAGHGCVELGYWIAPAYQGNGYATAAAELLVEYAFAERRLNSVRARVLAFNDASRRVLEGLGFEHIGRQREAFYVDGEFVDADLYDLLAAEWDSPSAAVTPGDEPDAGDQ